MRLIDADALAEQLAVNPEECPGCPEPEWIEDVFNLLDTAPTVEERRQGKWIRHPEVKNVYGGVYIECSECGEKYVVQWIQDEKYCRNCGAKMEGAQ